MIKSIFYSRFHPEKGPTILHQVPAGSISLANAPVPASKRPSESNALDRQRRSSSPPPPASPVRRVQSQPERAWTDTTNAPTKQEALFSLSAVSDYLIPRPEYHNMSITVCINDYRVIGFPVSIYGKQYPRNEFIFNFAVVVDIDAEVFVWTGIVKRIAALLREMEEVDGFLSDDETDASSEASAQETSNPRSGGGKVYALCEMILEDLNNYCECMIPLDAANTLNLKLFPLYPPPPRVTDYHVPLLTVDISTLADPNWDLTMQRVTPHINGVNSVSRIADFADADTRLVREAIKHLVYYGCCLLLDIFSFGASYAVTPAFGAFVADEEMQDECARYVSVAVAVTVERSGPAPTVGLETAQPEDQADAAPQRADGLPKDMEMSEVKRYDVIRLYASLKQGVSLKTWCLENKESLVGVDVRRLITFGVIRGFLYRIHKYAVTTGSKGKSSNTKKVAQTSKQRNEHVNIGRRSSINTLGGNSTRMKENLEEHLSRYLDGLHCFDELCTDLHVPEKSVLSALKARGEVQIIHR